jgi:hypothetical protein
MPEYQFKKDNYAAQQQITLSRQAILDLYRAAEQFPHVDTYDITVTPDGIKARFTLDFTRPAADSADLPTPSQEQVLAQLATLQARPPKKQEDKPNATHNHNTDRPSTETAE